MWKLSCESWQLGRKTSRQQRASLGEGLKETIERSMVVSIETVSKVGRIIVMLCGAGWEVSKVSKIIRETMEKVSKVREREDD